MQRHGASPSLRALEKFARSCKVLETIPTRAGIRRRRFCIERAGTAKVFAFHYHAAAIYPVLRICNIYIVFCVTIVIKTFPIKNIKNKTRSDRNVFQRNR